ncbi:hypothetical protein CA54_29440 [Symmachiella macrocystis]|uniref:Uncharacterized protein n=1 Tax=Symmachiella macrocystis TaxID=2527985 RepID=A0A5C6BQW3_9PLAN|nr:hypothetical protein CA54_29440 [Symmachiella macrocystis]
MCTKQRAQGGWGVCCDTMQMAQNDTLDSARCFIMGRSLPVPVSTVAFTQDICLLSMMTYVH